MNFFSSLRKSIRQALRPDDLHTEISDELRFHIDMKAADLMRNGVPADEARSLATKAFGSAVRAGEAGYDVRGSRMEELAGDLRFALRLLRKRPLRTAVLVATLALGIGLNTAVFGVVRSVLLEPLPFQNSETLVVLHQADHLERSGVSYPHYKDWLAGNRSFSDLAVYSSTSATLTGQGDPVIVFGATVSHSLFQILGVNPLRGRLFNKGEDRLAGGTATAVLISDRLWRSRFGEREDILGKLLLLDGRQFQIIGVIPSRLAFPLQKDALDYWSTVAVDADPALYGGSIPISRGYPRYDGAIARLKSGVSVAQAQADMNIVAHAIAREHPKATSANEVTVVPALQEVVGPSSRTMVLLLYAAVFCVLLVACVNVANILLVDAIARRREFSLRSALGAPAYKLVRQLLVESAVLALLGGIVSLFVADFVLHLFVAFAPPETPRLSEVHLGASSFFYVVLISLVSGLLFGCLPAFSMSKHDLASSLKEGAWAVSKKASGLRAGPILITIQIALSMVLTCSAAILVSSFDKILNSPRGFNPQKILTASVSLPVATYGQASKRVVNFYSSLLEDLRATPGVESASIAEVLPLSGQSNGTTVTIAGTNDPGLGAVNLRFVDSSYFKTLQIPLASGRVFTNQDAGDRPPVAIVNQAFVRRFLQGRNPLASELRLGWGGGKPKRVAGIVSDVRPTATSPASSPEVYVPFAQFPGNDMFVLLRTSSEPADLAAQLRTSVKRLDPTIPLDRIRSLGDYLLLSSASQQFLMWILIALSLTALLLSAVGLYGVLSESTASRAQEFGIRLALGAAPSRVVAMVLNQALSVAVIGLGAGSVLTVFTMRFLTRWLYDTPDHAQALVLSGAILLLVVLVACFVPSQRAARIDPSISLRMS